MLTKLGVVIFLSLLGLSLIRNFQARAWACIRLALLISAGLSSLGFAAICITQEGGWESIESRKSHGRGAFLGVFVIIFAKLGPTFTGLILLALGLYLMRTAYLRWVALRVPGDEAGLRDSS